MEYRDHLQICTIPKTGVSSVKAYWARWGGRSLRGARLGDGWLGITSLRPRTGRTPRRSVTNGACGSRASGPERRALLGPCAHGPQPTRQPFPPPQRPHLRPPERIAHPARHKTNHCQPETQSAQIHSGRAMLGAPGTSSQPPTDRAPRNERSLYHPALNTQWPQRSNVSAAEDGRGPNARSSGSERRALLGPCAHGPQPTRQPFPPQPPPSAVARHRFGTRRRWLTHATMVRLLMPPLCGSRETLAYSRVLEKSIYTLVGKIRAGPQRRRAGRTPRRWRVSRSPGWSRRVEPCGGCGL